MTTTGQYRVNITRVVATLGALLLWSAKKQLFYSHAGWTRNMKKEEQDAYIYILYYSYITGTGVVQSTDDCVLTMKNTPTCTDV